MGITATLLRMGREPRERKAEGVPSFFRAFYGAFENVRRTRGRKDRGEKGRGWRDSRSSSTIECYIPSYAVLRREEKGKKESVDPYLNEYQLGRETFPGEK